MDTIVQVEGLRKTYGATVAVDDISFEVQRGEIFGMVGPNGAGKTTTIECLEGLRKPDRGTIRVLGLDPQRESQALRERTGMQLQQSNLPERMKVWEALDLYASFYPKAVDWKELLVQLGLEEKRNAPFPQALRRAEAAPVHRPGPPARPAAGLPGRADHRPGPAGAPRHLGPGAGGARPGVRPSC